MAWTCGFGVPESALQGEQGIADGSPSWSNSESDELRLLSGPPTTSTMEFQDLSGFKAMLTG